MEKEQKEIVDLLSRLVACPSVNPKAQPLYDPPFGEERLVALLSDLLNGWGADVTVTEVLPRRPNLLARFRGKESSRCLLMDAHTDTVQVEGMTIPPFEPAVRDGKLFGRGSCDTKGPMAAMLMGLKDVLDEGSLPADVLFAATCNEELGADGARAMAKTGLKADAALIAEPTGLNIVHAHKGVTRWRIETKGLAAHASTPLRGKNAIYMMARLISRIEGPLSDLLRTREHPKMGCPVINVGTIQGGTQWNSVPDHCKIEVDRRLLPGETAESATAEIEEQLAALRASDSSFEVSYKMLQQYPPLEEPEDGPWVRRMSAACERTLGEARLAAAPYGTNAGYYKAVGIPCVVFGPGDIKQAHTAEEFIELSQLFKGRKVFAEVIRTFGTK